MARNPTWYSIKNQLTAGNVKASNALERLLTVIVTSYGCMCVSMTIGGDEYEQSRSR